MEQPHAFWNVLLTYARETQPQLCRAFRVVGRDDANPSGERHRRELFGGAVAVERQLRTEGGFGKPYTGGRAEGFTEQRQEDFAFFRVDFAQSAQAFFDVAVADAGVSAM